MENMEEEPPTPPSPTSPFWIQPTTRSRHRLPSPALFLSSGFLVVVLCISAIVFLALVVPSLLSLSHQFFRPNSVMKGWDSLNLVLVLFAVVCGFIVRKDHQEQKDHDLDNSFNVSTSQSPLSSHHQYDNWYDYEYCENVSWMHYQSRGLGNVTTLRRTSSSYPDLRQEISWDVDYDHRPRYYDDSYATNETRPPRSFRSIGSFRSQRRVDGNEEEVDHSDVKGIGMDTITRLAEKEVAPSSPPAPRLLSPPPPPTPPMYYSRIVRKPPRKEYETIAKRGIRKAKEPSPPIVKARPPPPPPAPPPPQPPPPLLDGHGWDDTRKKGAKSVTKDILTSIYHQSKRKNKLLKRKKSHENMKDLRPPRPPPPPPPPPPPSKLHNIFSSKKLKSGKKTSYSFTKSHSTTPKATEFDDHETTDSGYESQAIPIPPPPPPPPFKLPPWKFHVVHGDYIKITSSPKRGGGRGSDESEFEDGYSTTSSPVAGKAKPTAFCPSPDVNTKADDFIARFKATLKLEKINSGIGLSPLGPDSSPSLSPSPSPSPHAMAASGLF